MIKVEKELDLFDLVLEILFADELWALKQGFHRFFQREALSWKDCKVVLKVFRSFAENIGVTDDQSTYSFHIETFLVNKIALKCLQTSVRSLIE